MIPSASTSRLTSNWRLKPLSPKNTPSRVNISVEFEAIIRSFPPMLAEIGLEVWLTYLRDVRMWWRRPEDCPNRRNESKAWSLMVSLFCNHNKRRFNLLSAPAFWSLVEVSILESFGSLNTYSFSVVLCSTTAGQMSIPTMRKMVPIAMIGNA